MTLEIADIIVSAMGILLLTAWWFLLWKPLSVASLRQELLDARDDLFDQVVDRRTSLNFDSVVYRGTREDLNSMIRFSHEISVFISILASFIMPENKELYRQRIQNLHHGLSEEENKVISEIRHQQFQALSRFLISSSMVIWFSVTVICALAPIYFVYRIGKDGWNVCIIACKRFVLTPAIERMELESGQKYLFGCA